MLNMELDNSVDPGGLFQAFLFGEVRENSVDRSSTRIKHPGLRNNRTTDPAFHPPTVLFLESLHLLFK